MRASEPKTTYLFTPETDSTELLQQMRAHFQVVTDGKVKSSIQLYDTFDFRILRKDMFLCYENDLLCLQSVCNMNCEAEIELAEMVCFATDLPRGGLRKLVAPIIEMRALLVQASGTVEAAAFLLRDARAKIVARLRIKKYFNQQGRRKIPIATELQVTGVRGFDNSMKKIEDVLNQVASHRPESSALMLLLTEQAGEALAKPPVAMLTPEMNAHEALHELLLPNLFALRQNVDGICRDIDTEFLHDFRVAVRRARAALSQLKGILPLSDNDKYSEKFAALGKRTNRLRDLDVYLLEKETMIADLLPQMQEDIAPLFTALAEERALEQQKLSRYLRSTRFRNFLDEWEQYLLKQPDVLSIEALEGVLPLARRRIWFYYRRLVKRGMKITAMSADKKLHDLRLDAKKLRYLLEFFQTLFPKEEMTTFITALKKLQNNLGDFQDGSVQMEELLAYGQRVTGSSVKMRRALLASGSLLGQLHLRNQEIRRKFIVIFKDFAGKKTLQNMKHICFKQ
ncbi:MAG: CHAD domain-containing protein [Calditrichia bacterium]